MEIAINSTLQNWVLIIFSGIGFTFIVTQSRLFKILQKLYLFRCVMCFGFWSGAIIYFINTLEFSFKIIESGFICSIASYTLYLLLSSLIKKHG